MEKTITFVCWRIKDKYDSVISFGVNEYYGEFDLDKLPNGWCGDRLLHEVQETMEETELWKENGYIFEYKLYSLHNDLMITNEVDIKLEVENGI